MCSFWTPLAPQQMVLVTTVPVERVQDRSVEIRQAVEAFLYTLGLQPLSIQLEVFTTKSMEFGDPHPVARCWNFLYGAERRCIRLPSSTG